MQTMLLDDDEIAIIERYREIKKPPGFGRVEVVVVGGGLEALHHTFTLKKRDLHLQPKTT